MLKVKKAKRVVSTLSMMILLSSLITTNVQAAEMTKSSVVTEAQQAVYPGENKATAPDDYENEESEMMELPPIPGPKYGYICCPPIMETTDPYICCPPIPGPINGKTCCPPIDEEVETISLPPIPGPINGEDCCVNPGDTGACVPPVEDELGASAVMLDYSFGYPYITLEDYKGYSLVEGLKMFGYDSSFAFRKEFAEVIGIENYVGSYEQNAYLLYVLKNSVFYTPTPIPVEEIEVPKSR